MNDNKIWMKTMYVKYELKKVYNKILFLFFFNF